jgi:chemotaxis protein methyltransferase CheR
LQVEHLATDIAAATIARAKQGQYTQLEVNRGLPAHHLVEFFQKNGQGWQLFSDIRQMIQFRELNLAGDWPFVPELDLVLLRNLCIYLDSEVKRGILTRLHSRMWRRRILVLGATESAQGLEEFFEPVQRPQSLFYQVKK